MPRRCFLLVLDSVGIGAAPDAAAYGDAGAATLQHCAQALGGLSLPTLERMGLANILSLLEDQGPISGLNSQAEPLASWGCMRERSQGKDTITGHWELAGLELNPGFSLFPDEDPTFPSALTDALAQACGRPLLGNCHGSGTRLIQEYGEALQEQGAYLIYSSADSVFQIAAHVDVVPLEELYQTCRVARRLCDPYRVGRVIARPFRGKPGAYERTADRVDFAYETEEPTLLERLQAQGVPVYSVGKIEDIFAQRGISQGWHTGGNAESMLQLEQIADEFKEGFIFANLIDFDMCFGHRRDVQGYGRCLEEFDLWLASFVPRLGEGDLLLITADHGNDPVFKGTDHTREQVPLLMYQPGVPGRSLGIRDGFFDVAQTLCSWFRCSPMPRGMTFWEEKR